MPNHAYVLMTNHIHLLATPSDIQGITRMMQYIGRHYVPYISHAYGGSGSIWEERYKTNLAQDDQYLLICMGYIELNPVRADMVTRPEQYQWSIFHRNGRGEKDAVVMSHSLYHTLGRTIDLRQAAYVELFKAHVDDIDLS
jgi:putative transposase